MQHCILRRLSQSISLRSFSCQSKRSIYDASSFRSQLNSMPRNRRRYSKRFSKSLTLSDGVVPNAPIHLDPSALNDPLVKLSPAPFLFYPAFLSQEEQSVLLSASLQKLDASLTPSREVRKRRKAWRAEVTNDASAASDFLPEHLYDFEEVNLLISMNHNPLMIRSTRATMTVSSIITAKCMSLRGRKSPRYPLPRRPLYQASSNAYMTWFSRMSPLPLLRSTHRSRFRLICSISREPFYRMWIISTLVAQ